MPVSTRGLRYGAHVNRETGVSEFVPYTAHIAPDTIALRSGHLLQAVEVEGIAYETVDQAELNYLKDVRNTVLRAMGDPSFAIHHTCIRREIAPPAPAAFADPFCTELDATYTARLAEKRAFAISHVLFLLYRPLADPTRAGGLGLARLLPGTDTRARTRERAKAIKALSTVAAHVLTTLERYGARKLSVVETASGPSSEILRVLGYLLNHEDRGIGLPHQDLATYLPTARISFGKDALEIRGATRDRTHVGAIVSIKEYPPRTAPGMLDALLRCPHEFVLTQTYATVAKQRSLGRLARAARRMDQAEDPAVSLRDQLEEARDAAASGRVTFGEHHLTICVFARSIEGLDRAVSDIVSELTNLEIVAVREDLNLEPAFWAQLPGNFPYIARKSLISSANFSGFASLHSFPQGERERAYWGAPVTTLETTSGAPYAFNFHHRDLGNWLCIGPSGSGKSVLLTFLLAQAQRFAPRSVYFDKDRGAELAIRAMGGAYRLIRPGTGGLGNPFALPDTPPNRAFLRDLLALLVSEPGRPALSPAERAVISDAVEENYAQDPGYRQLCYLQELFRGHERSSSDSLATRLKPWHGDGELAWLFDTKESALDFSARTTGFDLTYLLDAPVLRTPALFYLFHRVDALLDGSKTLIFIDEAWKALDDPLFEARLKDWLKTVRKRNGLVGFASQSAQDALRSRISDSIVEQTPTQIFMPNLKADPEAYCEGFGLTAREFDLIRSLPDTARCFLVKHGQHSVLARLDLDGLDDLLAVLSGREETVRLLDTIRAEVGDDPRVWLPVFHERRRSA